MCLIWSWATDPRQLRKSDSCAYRNGQEGVVWPKQSWSGQAKDTKWKICRQGTTNVATPAGYYSFLSAPREYKTSLANDQGMQYKEFLTLLIIVELLAQTMLLLPALSVQYSKHEIG